MFIRVTHFKAIDGRWDDLVNVFNESTIPHLEAKEGFMRVILTGDKGLGQGSIITMWKNAELGGGEGTGGTDCALDTINDLIAGQPSTSGYVEISEREF